jgi:hypothetical protein
VQLESAISVAGAFVNLDIFVVLTPAGVFLSFVCGYAIVYFIVGRETAPSLFTMSSHLHSPRGDAQRRLGFIYLVFSSRSHMCYDTGRSDHIGERLREPTG